jgi:hypothetical protein
MAVRDVMDPPFSTGRQALGFALVLLVLLLLPVGLSKMRLVSRQQVYRAVPNEWGAFPYIHKQIFEEKSGIDILILGTSLLYQAIDAPYLKQQLSRSLGREATVVTFGTNWRCESLNYLLLRDVLKRRKVGLLVFSMPVDYQNDELPHVESFRWFLYGEDDASLDGLPPRDRLTFHAETVLGAPRHVLSLIRSDRVVEHRYDAELGASKIEKGIRPARFIRFTPAPPKLPAHSMIYSPDTSASFRFTGQALNSYQVHYLRLIVKLLKRYGVPVTLIRVPLWTERHSNVVEERMPWSEVFGMPMTLIGVPPARLFQGLKNREIDLLFYNDYDFPNHHLNRNGNEYFTRVIAPAILKTYAQNSQPAH